MLCMMTGRAIKLRMPGYICIHLPVLLSVAHVAGLIQSAHGRDFPRRVGTVTLCTCFLHRGMDIFPHCKFFIVADQTYICPFLTQHKRVGRLMRIMTPGTITFFFRRMDNLSVKMTAFVAYVTELSGIGDGLAGGWTTFPRNGFEFMRSRRFVAYGALVYRYRTMNILLLSHSCVTFGCHARRFLSC